jgi:hypothetical protein
MEADEFGTAGVTWVAISQFNLKQFPLFSALSNGIAGGFGAKRLP